MNTRKPSKKVHIRRFDPSSKQDGEEVKPYALTREGKEFYDSNTIASSWIGNSCVMFIAYQIHTIDELNTNNNENTKEYLAIKCR
eukprot:Pgem_evm1s5108